MGYRMRKAVIVCALVLALAVSLGAVDPRDAAAVWTHSLSGGYDVWFWDGAQKFRYQTGNQQWWHYSTVGTTWVALSATGRPSTFIGDGGTYNLGNGLNYRYTVANDFGFFARGGAYRFYYQYTPGKWFTSGYGGGWYVLGAAGLTAAMVDGSSHDLGNGLNYRYTVANDFGFFARGGAYRFYYQYTPGKWFTSGYGGGWYALGAAGLTAAMVDGSSHDLGNGLNYRYALANDFGFFARGGAYRFYYQYTPGKWFTSGYGGGWYVLGAAGLAASFVGDGTYHDLGNGFWFRYGQSTNPANDQAVWSRNGLSSGNRLLYRYSTGLWGHVGSFGTLNFLGNGGMSTSFLGDGTYHDLGNGFWFRYVQSTNPANDQAVWSRNDLTGNRFLYRYSTGLWQHNGSFGTFNTLGNGGMSTSFLGDGTYHDLGNGFWFRYVQSTNRANDQAVWSTNGLNSGNRFRYQYSTGLWGHVGSFGFFNALGNGGMSTSFLGDGTSHDLGNGFWFRYAQQTDRALDRAGWSLDSLSSSDRFLYTYSTGLWVHRGIFGGIFSALGHAGMTTSFVGDGSWHDLGNGYSYILTNNVGYWQASGTQVQYSYAYSSGTWEYHPTFTDPWTTLAGPEAGTELYNPGEP